MSSGFELKVQAADAKHHLQSKSIKPKQLKKAGLRMMQQEVEDEEIVLAVSEHTLATIY